VLLVSAFGELLWFFDLFGILLVHACQPLLVGHITVVGEGQEEFVGAVCCHHLFSLSSSLFCHHWCDAKMVVLLLGHQSDAIQSIQVDPCW